MKRLLLLTGFWITISTAMSQVAINTNGDAANSSAMLDVQSTSKGMLIPRMTASQRNSISSPATGLLVFVTDDSTFYQYSGHSWRKISSWTLRNNSLYTDTTLSVGIGTSTPSGRFEVSTINHTGSYWGDMCSGGTASASESYPGQPADNGFDNLITTYWSNNNHLPAWIMYDLGEGTRKRVGRYNIYYDASVNSDNSPDDWYFQGSNDGTNWTTLDMQFSQGWNSSGWHTYTISNTNLYRYYRLYITDNKGTNNDYVSVYEMEMKEEQLINDHTLVVTDNKVGIGTVSPEAGLDIESSFRFRDGNQATGKILSSDADGNVSWTDGATLNGGGWSVSGNNSYKSSGNVAIGTSNTGYGEFAVINSDNELNSIYIDGDYNDYQNHNGINNRLTGKMFSSRGIFNYIHPDTSGNFYGTENYLSNAKGFVVGTYNNIEIDGFATRYGTENSFFGTGTGNTTGVYNSFITSVTGTLTGVYNNINSSNGIHYGIFNYLKNDSSYEQDGFYNYLTGNGNGHQYGIYQIIDNDGDGNHFGFTNTLSGSGNGPQYGINQSITNDGNGYHYGFNNYLGGNGGGYQYGIYQEIDNSGNLNHYGLYNKLTNSGNGYQYGIFQYIDNTGNGNHYGLYNKLTGSSVATQYGIYQEIDNSGNNQHYGIYTYLTGSGSGDKYGEYIYISSPAGGTHYGIYSYALGSTNYAGYFVGRVYIKDKLGIGTNNPSANLHVDGFFRYEDGNEASGKILSSDAVGNASWTDGTTLNGGGWTVSGSNSYKTSGDVGIGTSSPHELLEVAEPSGGHGRFIVSDGQGSDRRVILLVSPTSSDDYARIDAYKYGTGGGGKELRINTVGHGNVVMGGTTMPDSDQGEDLGAPDRAWDDLYYYNAHDMGVAAFSNRKVTDEILNFPPKPKPVGAFNQKNGKGSEELDPNSVPPGLKDGYGILTDEMTSYNYKANYEQQLQIESLKKQLKEQEQLIDELKQELLQLKQNDRSLK